MAIDSSEQIEKFKEFLEQEYEKDIYLLNDKGNLVNTLIFYAEGPNRIITLGGDSDEQLIITEEDDMVLNTIDFEVINTGINYNNIVFTPEILTTFSFLSSTFQLTLSETNNQITFTNINDENDGISKMKTYRGALITLDEEDSKVILKEEDGKETEFYLTYDNFNMEIKINRLETTSGIQIQGKTDYGSGIDGYMQHGGKVTIVYPDE